MQVGGIFDFIGTAIKTAPAGAVDAAGKAVATSVSAGSIADTLIKGGTAVLQTRTALEVAKINAKGQKYNMPQGYDQYGNATGTRQDTPTDYRALLGQNGGVILAGVGILTVVAIALSMTKAK